MELYDHSPVDYHYNYGDRISYPHDPRPHGPYGSQGRFLGNRELPSNRLYSDGLMQLSRKTEAHVERLKEKLAQIDPCYAFGMEHWHPDRRTARRESGTVDLPEGSQPKWRDADTMFGSSTQMHRHMQRPRSEHGVDFEKENSGPSSGAAVNKFCYLCTTLEEHQQHIARRGRQLKEKHKPKVRVEYIAPPPIVKRKKEEVEEKQDVLYKVTVKTSNRPDVDTSTNANVFIRFRGRKGEMRKRQLKKKLPGNFCFGRGTTETFHLRGPKIGEIRSLIIEHDGLEKKHSWLLDEIEVTNLNTGEKWVFPCGAWLSLFRGDCRLKRELRAEILETPEVEYAISVVTGDKRFAGTDANVFITLYGKKGVSKKIPLRNKSKDNFERGQTDIFTTVMEDIGPISKIKIEHDGAGPGAGWLLEKVIIEDTADAYRKYVFPCGQWLAEDEGDGALFKMLFALGRHKHGGGESRHGRGGERGGRFNDDQEDYVEGESYGPQLSYDVSVLTGNIRHAGTDAHVYLQLYGKGGISQEVELDDEKDNFERNMTDNFKIRAKDVGDLKKIRIRHDDSGLGAGWFLEKMVIRRYFSKEEVRERLSHMQGELEESVAQRASEVTGEDIRPPSRAESLRHSGSIKRKGTRSNRESIRRGTVVRLDDSDSDDSSDERGGGRRKTHKNRRNKKKAMDYRGHTVYVTDSDSEDDSDYDDRRKRDGKRGGRKNKKRDQSDSSDSDDGYQKRDKRRSGPRSSSTTRRSRSRQGYGSDSDGKSSKIWKKDRIPLCDEYLFTCGRWLATDEDDGQLERFLKPKSVTTFYKVNK